MKRKRGALAGPAIGFREVLAALSLLFTIMGACVTLGHNWGNLDHRILTLELGCKHEEKP